MNQIVRVAVGILTDENNQVLVARRHDNSHQGGLWEFPGGKQHVEETRYEALCRELDEELGIHVNRARPLIRVAHDYGDRHVELDVWQVEDYSGTPDGCEGQPVRWVSHDELDQLAMPAADRPIIQAIRLPPYYAISPEPGSDLAQFIRDAAKVFASGVTLLQLRTRSPDPASFDQLATQMIELARQYHSRLLINSDVATAVRLGADGVHLNAENARQLHAAGAANELAGLLVGVSCHNLEELQLAQQLGADFAVLSPVKPTRSHPDAEPMGWERFENLVGQVSLPVYALGGLDRSDQQRASESGAQGIAAIRGFWTEAE